MQEITKEVVDYYNGKQDEWKILKIIDVNYKIIFRDSIYPTGFYEWLFNPKYKVFEVFVKDNVQIGLFRKQPKEIIKYLRGVI